MTTLTSLIQQWPRYHSQQGIPHKDGATEQTLCYTKNANNHVSKLRTILLYEADFNAMNKILGKSMLANGEEHKSLAEEQYESRRNKTSIIQCFNKRLTFDLWRQYKVNGAILSNDAKSC